MVLVPPPPLLAGILAQEDVDALPRLSPPAFACVLVLVGVLWLMARVTVERRAQRGGSGPRSSLGFVRRLAVWPPALAILGLLGVALAAAAWLLR